MIERAVFFGGPNDGEVRTLVGVTPFRSGERFDVYAPPPPATAILAQSQEVVSAPSPFEPRLVGSYVVERDGNFVWFRWEAAP